MTMVTELETMAPQFEMRVLSALEDMIDMQFMLSAPEPTSIAARKIANAREVLDIAKRMVERRSQ